MPINEAILALAIELKTAQTEADLERVNKKIKKFAKSRVLDSREEAGAINLVNKSQRNLDDRRARHISGMERQRRANQALTHSNLTLGASQQRLGTQLRGSTMAGQDLGRVFSDMPYGMIGISNNIEPLVMSFKRLQLQAAATGMSMKTALLGVMTGPGGLMLSMGLLTGGMVGIPKLIDMFKSTDEEATKAAKGGLKKFADRLNEIANALDKLTGEQRGARGEISRGEYAMKYARYHLFKKILASVEGGGATTAVVTGAEAKAAGLPMGGYKGTTEELKKAIEALRAELWNLRHSISGAAMSEVVATGTAGAGAGGTGEAPKPTGLTPEQWRRQQAYSWRARQIAKYTKGPAYRGRRGKEEEAGAGEKPTYTIGLMKDMQGAVSSVANTITSEIGAAFENVFGQATSLFEKLMKTVIEQISSVLITRGLFSLLSMLFPPLAPLGFAGLLAMQHGGVIREPVVGMGLRTGTIHTLGERGPERVTPVGSTHGSGGGGADIIGALKNMTWKLRGHDMVLSYDANKAMMNRRRFH